MGLQKISVIYGKVKEVEGIMVLVIYTDESPLFWN